MKHGLWFVVVSIIALSGCGDSTGVSADQQARIDAQIEKAAKDAARQTRQDDRIRELQRKVAAGERARRPAAGSAVRPGTAPVPAASAPSRSGGAPSCDRGPGTLVWRFAATESSRGKTFDVRLCQTSNGSWYYGSTDSQGGGVSAVALSGPEGAWRSNNGVYEVVFSEGTACVTVRVRGAVAAGFPACGPLVAAQGGE